MRQKLFYCFMLICSLSIFTSCKDDDNDKIDLGTAIAGTYKGDLSVSLGSANQAGDLSHPGRGNAKKGMGNAISAVYLRYTYAMLPLSSTTESIA